MTTVDIEKINRDNFRSLMNSLSMPGNLEKIEPIFNSSFLSIASVVLYSEVSYFYEGNEEFSLIDAITNPKKEDIKNADYIFCDKECLKALAKAKIGDYENPEFSTTFIIKESEHKTKVKLKGPGIDGAKTVEIPLSPEFLELRDEKNHLYPLGNDVFILTNKSQIIGLPRTTKVEVL